MKREKYNELMKELRQLRKDNYDMYRAWGTSFRRCPKCNRLSDTDRCFYCGSLFSHLPGCGT